MRVPIAARRAKHGAYLASRAVGRWHVRFRAGLDVGRNSLVPFRFEQSRYEDAHGYPPFDYFLHRSADSGQIQPPSEVPDHLWCFWTGDNPLTKNREQAIRSMREANPDLQVTLVTPSNLALYLVDGHPLHPSYGWLSTNHRSDYLRAYFMHHHGGAYADIKRTSVGLSDAIRRVRSDPHTWILGPNDPDLNLVGNLFGPVGDDTRRNHRRIASVAAMVARSHTELTAEWLNEVERRISYYTYDLQRSPAVDPFGREGNYPITWIGLGANVFQPLQLKYLDRVKVDNSLMPSVLDYR